MSDLTEALARGVYWREGVYWRAWTSKVEIDADQFIAIANAARLVANGKVIPVEDIDYEAAWERYYVLADRRNKEGLTALMLRDVIDTALHLPGDKEHRG